MKFTFSHKAHESNHRLASPKHFFLHRIGRDAVTDWILMCIAGAALVFVFVGIGYIRYVSSKVVINTESEISIPEKVVDFNDQRLDSVISAFEARKDIRTKMDRGEMVIPDPGL